MFIDIFKTHDNIFKSKQPLHTLSIYPSQLTFYSKGIENTLEQVGLQDMIDELSNALTVFILTAIDPWISPIVKQVKDGITLGMEAIAGTEDQTIVFTDPNASEYVYLRYANASGCRSLCPGMLALRTLFCRKTTMIICSMRRKCSLVSEVGRN